MLKKKKKTTNDDINTRYKLLLKNINRDREREKGANYPRKVPNFSTLGKLLTII